jgi:hypothetical protein
MARWRIYSAILIVLAVAGTLALAGVSSARQKIAKDDQWYQWYPAENWSYKNENQVKLKFNLKGKTSGTVHPKEAIFGQIFLDKRDGREWIFDGMQWVPHDDTVDDYYEFLKAVKMTPPNMKCTTEYSTSAEEGQK